MLECYKWNLMGHHSRSLEDINAENDVNPLKRFQMGTILATWLAVLVIFWIRMWLHFVLV